MCTDAFGRFTPQNGRGRRRNPDGSGWLQRRARGCARPGCRLVDVVVAAGRQPQRPPCGNADGASYACAALQQPKLLVAAKANPNLADRTGNTALYVAGQINKPWHALDLLLVAANPELTNAQDQTFDHYLFMTPVAPVTNAIRDGRRAVWDYLVLKDSPATWDKSLSAAARGEIRTANCPFSIL
jgi:hypothetical protein